MKLIKTIAIAIGLIAVVVNPVNAYALEQVDAIKEQKDVYMTNRNGIEISSEKYANLVSMGFQDDEIMWLDEATIERNGTISGTVVSSEVSYVKSLNVSTEKYDILTKNIVGDVNKSSKEISIEMNEEDFFRELSEIEGANAKGYDGEYVQEQKKWGYRTLTTRVVQVGTGSSRKYKVYNLVQYYTTPLNRSYDVSTIAFKSPYISVQANSNYGFQTHTRVKKSNNAVSYQTTNYSTSASNFTKRANGYGLNFGVTDTDW